MRLFCALVFACRVAAASAEPAVTPLDASTLAALNGNGTFAKPLAVGSDILVLFERDGPQAIVRCIDWRTSTVTREPRPDVPLSEKERYTALATTAGLWLVGPKIVLERADGTRIARDFDTNEPVAVGLHDGAILVFDDRAGNVNRAAHIRRVSIDAAGALAVADLGILSYDGPSNRSGERNRQPRYGYAATTLADGRVLVVGGGDTPSLASIFDPATATMHPAAPPPHPRSLAATVLLPDGRVVVAGAEHLRCYEPAAREVDVYDPKADAWTTLPPLPFPLCSDAYYADMPSLAVGPHGGIVAGGHLEDHVLVLPSDAHGFAASWRVVGKLAQPHISGVLQVLSDGDIAVAGGVYNPERFGGCCRISPGVEKISRWMKTEPYDAGGLSLNGAAAVQRNDRALVVAGRRFSWTGSGQMRYSSVAELVTLDDGKVEQIDALPFATGGADAVWLDDDRVLVKGRPAAEERGFEAGQNLSSYLPASSGAAAIYHVSSARWRSVPLAPELFASRLIGVDGETALLFAADASVQAIDLGDGKVRAVAQAALRRKGANARRLADGRIVIAGGHAQSDLVSLVDESCAGEDTDAACPERFVGYGPYGPARRYEMLRPGNAGAQAESTLSEPSRGAGTSAAIGIDGRVTQVGWTGEPNNPDAARLVIERSDAAGKSWKTLPLPDDLPTAPDDQAHCSASEPDACRLLLAAEPRDPARELMFLRSGNVAGEDVEPRYARLRVWWFDADAGRWQSLFDLKGPAARTPPIDLPAPLEGLRAKGWQLDAPLVWSAGS